jgi:hypothetical protein
MRRGLSSGTRGDEFHDLVGGVDTFLFGNAIRPVDREAGILAERRNSRLDWIQEDDRGSSVGAVHEHLFEYVIRPIQDDGVDVPLEQIRRRIEIVDGERKPAVAGDVMLIRIILQTFLRRHGPVEHLRLRRSDDKDDVSFLSHRGRERDEI